MQQRRERALAVVALLAMMAIVAAQIALLVTHVFVPMVQVADRLAREDPSATPQGPQRAGRRPEDAAGTPWRWVSLLLTLAATAITACAVFRLRRSRAAALQWAWVVRMGVTLIPVGLLVFWLLSGPAAWYRGFFGRAAGP
ncbi:MAG: hypothetical protein ACP5KN_07720 [Armatimonadota bacterium]